MWLFGDGGWRDTVEVQRVLKGGQLVVPGVPYITSPDRLQAS